MVHGMGTKVTKLGNELTFERIRDHGTREGLTDSPTSETGDCAPPLSDPSSYAVLLESESDEVHR